MKDFIKKKMYLILLVVSFSTLFSAILYADPLYCNNDSECPQGMICVIPGNFCMEAGVISCTQNPILNHLCYCYKPIEDRESPVFKVDCDFTGIETDECIPIIGEWVPYF